MNPIKSICLAMTVIAGCLSAPGLFAETNSIIDSAASSSEVRHRLIADYEVGTNAILNDRLMVVAVSYAVESNYDKAEPVYEKYLQAHPDDLDVLRSLGICCAFQKRYEKAASYFKKGWQLGDKDALQGLAVAYLNEGHYSELEDLRPSLIKNKGGNERIATCLLGLALSKDPPDEGLILSALEEIPDKEIFLHDDTDRFLAKAIGSLQTPEANNTTYQAICRKMIRGYLVDTNTWPKKNLLDVGDAYRALMDYSNAEVLYKAALKVYPSDEHALFGLGVAELFQHRPVEAIVPLREAWKRGRPEALTPLGAACAMSENFEGMKDLVPAFLAHRDDIDNVTTLIAYSIKIKPPSKETFYKAIDGLTDEQLARHDNMTDLAALGFRYFGDEKRAQRVLKLKAEQEKGAGG
jgi:tetratricopeptide (TPR) repeat protein